MNFIAGEMARVNQYNTHWVNGFPKGTLVKILYFDRARGPNGSYVVEWKGIRTTYAAIFLDKVVASSRYKRNLPTWF